MTLDLTWPNVFSTLKPGTRVRVNHTGGGFYPDKGEGVILTHSEDGCTLIAFDHPLRLEATTTKPAGAWWAETAYLEVL